MHSLVTTVLLGIAWLNAFEPNAKSDPPDGESREPAGGECREWRPVVRADRPWQSVLAEGGLEHAFGASVQRASQGPAAQQVATEAVADRQRMTTLAATPAADREATLEIGTPDGVRRVVLTQPVAVR